MNTIKLKNGSEEVEALVATTMMALRGLFDEKPMVVYELAMLARDRNHKPFGGMTADIETVGLVQEGQMHGSIRNIVLSAVEGEGLEITLGDPRRVQNENGDHHA